MKMLRATLMLAATLASSFAYGQATLLQGGPFAPGHVPMYVGQGSTQPIVQDSGTAAGGPLGVGLSELGITSRSLTGSYPVAGTGTGPFGTHACMYDAPTNNLTGYHYLCLDPNVGSAGLLAYGAGGTATQLPFTMNINGTNYSFPFVLSGVVGPSTTTVGHLALWNNTTGTLLSDGGPLSFSAFSGTVSPAQGGTGVASPTGYLYGNGTSPATASTTIPATVIPFTSNGTGAVASTVDATLRQNAINLQAFGADPTDTTAADTAISNWYAQMLASGKCGYVPAGTYRVTTQRVFELSTVRLTGICIFGDGQQKSLFDGSSITSSPNFVLQASGGTTGSPVSAFYPTIVDVGFKGNIAGTVFQVGKADLSDQLNIINLRIWVADTNTSSSANAVAINSTFGSNNFNLTANNAGHGYAINLLNSQFGNFNVSAGNADYSLACTGTGYSYGNVFNAPDFEADTLGNVLITGANCFNNTTVGGQFAYPNATTAITATNGRNNLFINPNFTTPGTVSVLSVTGNDQAIVQYPNGLTQGASQADFNLNNSAGEYQFNIDTSGNGYVTDYVTNKNLNYSVAGTGLHSFFVNGTAVASVTGTGLNSNLSYFLNSRLLVSGTAPTISSGFGSGAAIANSNGTASFRVNVGSGGTATNGTIGLPTTTNGWNCSATDITETTSTIFITKQSGTSATAVTFYNYNDTGGTAAWGANDILSVNCLPD